MCAQKEIDGVAAARPAGGGRGTRVAAVTGALRESIVRGGLEPGDKLPTEVELTREYNVSRTVVREAVASLRAAGLVEVRHGVGVFICEPVVQSGMFRPVDRARISSMIELLELRTAIEIEAAGLAAERRSPAQEEMLFERFDEIARLIDDGEGGATAGADREFHLAVADATNNPRFRECLTLLGEHLVPRSALPDTLDNTPSEGYLKQIQAEHRAIIAAVSDQDPVTARKTMRTHLKGSKDRYRRLIRG